MSFVHALCTQALLGLLISSSFNSIAQAKAAGPGEGELNILAWPGYIERGTTDPQYDWVTEFEKKTGCQVKVKTANTSDEMIAIMGEGTMDLVTASGDASLRLVYMGLVRELSPETITGWDTIDPRLQNASWIVAKGRHFGVPYQWGGNILLYSKAAFKTPPDSWKVVFEKLTLPDGKSNTGRVQAFNNPIYIADAALYLMTAQPELGIQDPYALNPTQYQAALDLLRGQHRLVVNYWRDPEAQMDDFLKGRVVAAPSWPYQVNLLQAKDNRFAAIIPLEGVTGWSDSTMMYYKPAHPNCAHLWMEHSLTLKVQGDVAAWFGSVPAVPAACENNALLGQDGCRQNGAENFAQVYFWRTPISKCNIYPECVPYYRWVSDYQAILGEH